MQILTVRVDGKTYTASAITTGLARETLRCMEELTAVRHQAQALDADCGAAEILPAVRARLPLLSSSSNSWTRIRIPPGSRT